MMRTISRENEKILPGNGVFERYKYPILTAEHPPLEWRYDFNPETNPYLMERFGINAVFNAGAIKFNGKYLVMARVEGHDRKSFFAIAESPNGIDNFRFWEYPVQLPDLYPEETNVYDMRLTKHEDGWIYGIFCSESKDPDAPAGDLTSAIAAAGIIRSRDGQKLGTPAQPRLPKPATECSAAPRVRRRKICIVHPSAGRIHRCRQRRRYFMGIDRRYHSCSDQEGNRHRTAPLSHDQRSEKR